MGVVPYQISMPLPLVFLSGILGRLGPPSAFGELPVHPGSEHQASLVPPALPWTVFSVGHHCGSVSVLLLVLVVCPADAAGAGVDHSGNVLQTGVAFALLGYQAPGTCVPPMLPVVLVLGC